MTGQVLRVFSHEHNTLEVARQDYELAKQEVDRMLIKGFHRLSHYHERFQAGVDRRDQARERWLRAMGA